MQTVSSCGIADSTTRNQDSTVATATIATSISSTSNSNVLCAMKSIHHQHLCNQVFVDHHHIVRVRETCDWQCQLFVIVELCSGGDLCSCDAHTEADAVRITRTVLSAVTDMHSKEVHAL